MSLRKRPRPCYDWSRLIENEESFFLARPSAFDGGGGRGHQGTTFSVALAGGGLNHCGAWGVTDELCKKPLEGACSVPDLFATILADLGINPGKERFDGDRPVPITDQGTPITELLT